MVVKGPNMNRDGDEKGNVMMMLEEVFLECDKDLDGLLSLSELVNFCDRLNNSSSFPSSLFLSSSPLPPSAIMARNLLGSADWGKKLSLNELYSQLNGVWICDTTSSSSSPMRDELVAVTQQPTNRQLQHQSHRRISAYQCQSRQNENQNHNHNNQTASNQSISIRLHSQFTEDAKLSTCKFVHSSNPHCLPVSSTAFDPSTRFQHLTSFKVATPASRISPPPTPSPVSRFTRHTDSTAATFNGSSSSQISLNSNSFLLSTPLPVHKGHAQGQGIGRNTERRPFVLFNPHCAHVYSCDPGVTLSGHNLTSFSSSSSSFVAMQQQPQQMTSSSSHTCFSSKSDLHKTISMLSVCSQKTGESSGWVSSAATGSGALVGVGVAIKNNRNKNNRSRHMSNSNNNNNNNQSTASSSHRRLHSSSSIKMMTSQSHLCGIDNEAFVLTPTDNNTCCANVAYDYTNDDYDVRDNEDQIDGDLAAAGDSQNLAADCSVIERTIREVCDSRGRTGTGSHMILGRETLDYAESQLSEEEQRQLLKHVICTISGRPNINPKPHSYQSGDVQHEEDDENDDDSLNEVIDQVRSLVMAKLEMETTQKGMGKMANREGRLDEESYSEIVVTPQKLASALFLVAQGYEHEHEHEQSTNTSDVIASRQHHHAMTSSQSSVNNFESQNSNNSTVTANFVPISNQISGMHVFTGHMLESIGVDVGALNQAQMFKNRVVLEQLVSSLLDRVSQEGIYSHPKVAVALYLLRIISDFSKEEVEDLEKHVMSQQQLFKETVEHFERSQMDTDSHIDRLNSQHNALIKKMNCAHEVEMDRLKKQHDCEKMQMESEHRHELLKLRTQLDRLNSRNCTLKDKINTYDKETKEQTLTINKLEDERKQLLYDRSILEDTLHKSPHLFHDTDMDTLSGAGLNFHHNFLSPCHSSTAGGPHDNFGAVSSPNSTLKWETCSDGSIERDEFLSLENNPIMEDEECNSSTGGPGGNRNNFKGSTIYLYIENDKRSHRNSAQSETQNKVSTFELNEDINEEQRNFSAICCSIVQLTRSFRNTRKQKTHKQSKDKSRTTRVASGHDNSSHSAYFSKRVSSSSVRKK